MSLSLDITAHDVHIYGHPDLHSAYSLSGHVSITLPPSRKLTRLLLKSLLLTFEGQSEFVSPWAGYVPLRLCTITRDLAPTDPFELTNHPSDPVKYNVVFNLTVPAWLPATTPFADAGTRYALHASAEFVRREPDASRFAFWSGLRHFAKTSRCAHARMCEVRVNRYARPSPFLVTYNIKSADRPKEGAFPLHRLRIVARMPEGVGLEDGSIPFSCRLSLGGGEEVQVTEFKADVVQCETYRKRPCPSYVAKYPVPPPSLQPPHVPLIKPNPMVTMYEFGFVVPLHVVPKPTKIVSFAPGEARYTLGSEVDGEGAWCTLRSDVPFGRTGVERVVGAHQQADAEAPVLRVSARSPLFDVTHSVHVSVTCVYGAATERVSFTLPLRVGELSGESSASLASSSSSLVDSLGGVVVLPPYSQLYELDGERKVDWELPLPRYER